MSKSLVKKALELCKDDDDENIYKINLSKSSKLKMKKGVNLKSKEEEIYLKKGKQARSIIEKYRIQNNKNNLDSNLVYLKRISKPIVKYDTIKTALEKNKPSKPSKDKKEVQEESVFTEKDFKDFAKSYFGK